MNIFGQILLMVVSIAYPLLWYFGREHGAFMWLAAAMALLWSVRAAMQKVKAQRVISLILAAFFAFLLIFRLPETMYWYPVAVNILMLTLFGSSLFAKQTIIERLARLQTPDFPPEAVRYTRTITQIWCVFFVANGTIAALLALSGSHNWWAIYTGVIAYILMGILLGGEWLYRKLILKV